MARYGIDLYGAPTLYGTDGNENLFWDLEVDWADAGSFDGSNEAFNRMISISSTRGRKWFLQSNRKGFQPYSIGKITIELDNYDERFNPNNANSPLFGIIDTGKFAQLSVKNGESGAILPVFTGIIEDIKPKGRDNWSRVNMTLLDGWDWLRTRINLALQASLVSDTAIGDILDNIQWPSRWGRALATGATTLAFFFADAKGGSKTIRDIADAEIARAFVAKDGKFTFNSRHVVDTSIATITQAEMLQDISERSPWEVISNIVRVKAHPLKVESTQDIWQNDEIPSVAAGDTYTIWLEYNFNNQDVPATNVITPASTTDFTANTQADGGGVDKTADFAVSSFSAFANTAKLVMINNGGVSAFLTLTKVRGDPISSENVAFQEAMAGDSATKPRTLELDLIWQQSVNDARLQADFLADLLSNKNPFPIFRMEKQPALQFLIDIASQVTISISELSIAADYRIGYISMRSLHPNMQSVMTEVRLEPFFDATNFWTFPTAIGTTSIFPY